MASLGQKMGNFDGQYLEKQNYVYVQNCKEYSPKSTAFLTEINLF